MRRTGLVDPRDERRRKAVLAAAQQPDLHRRAALCSVHPCIPPLDAGLVCSTMSRTTALRSPVCAIDRELPIGAGALAQHRMHVLDRPAALQVVHHVVDELEQLEGEVAHRHFLRACRSRSACRRCPSAPRATCSLRSARGDRGGSPGCWPRSRHSFTTIACTSAPSMTATSGRVGTSQTRNSSVPNVGCGRTSHQIFFASSMQWRSTSSWT